MKLPRCLDWTLALVLLTTALPGRADITSDFDDEVYPGTAGDGWAGPWQNSPGGSPEVLTEDAMDEGTPYLGLDMTDVSIRNLMREYDASGDVDITKPHRIQWRFRLREAGFETEFDSFNDRVHLFGRNGARLTGSTDSSDSWAILAAGAAHGSGVAAGRTFWIYDNVAGDSAFNAGNHVDSGVPLVPDHVYFFEVQVTPADLAYTVSIVNETSGASFSSSAPHTFRDLSATLDSHTLIHFGVQASPSSLNRAFEIDSVSISAVPLSEVPPQIINVVPEANSFHSAGDGMQFEVTSAEPIAETGISLVLNGLDVSGGLAISGDATHRTVRYEGLEANVVYTAEITVSNSLGTSSTSFQFNTAEGESILFDAGGFEDEFVYPEGDLLAVTDGEGSWAPAGEPAQIVDLADGQFGQVLRREQTGNSNTEILSFPGPAAGMLTIEFDARVSTTTARTLDVMLLPPSGSQMASMLGWGINAGKVAYYDGSAWISAADIDTEWHHYEMINYLSGTLAGTWDFKMDGVVIGRGLPWRHAITEGTALSRLRLGAIRGSAGEFADIDNLKLLVGPEPSSPPALDNIVPAHRTHFYAAEGGIHFEATSEEPILESGIRLILNDEDVSDQLVIGGDPTSRVIEFDGLEANRLYTAELVVGNLLGENTATIQFDTISEPTAIVDVNGFESAGSYPVGDLGAIEEDHGVWTPGRTGAPAEIIDLGGEPGQVLRRSQTGEVNVDLMDFPAFTAGVLTIEFDARVSTAASRTLDLSLNRTGQDQRAASLSWGTVPGRLAYEEGGAWTDIMDMDEEWHHYKLVNHLDGPSGQSFDLIVDGETVAENLPWNGNFNAETAVFGRLRIGAEDGLAGEFGDLDNLVISVAPPPPAISGLVPAALEIFHPASGGLRFEVSSAGAISAGDIQVVLNGADVSGSLEVTGGPDVFQVSYNDLEPDTFYTAEITVSGPTGTSVLPHQFATFQAGQTVTVEAEDYNYQGGQFIDNPPPSGYRADGTQVNEGVGYVDRQGVQGTDYWINSPPAGDVNQIYRFFDSTGTRHTSDDTRQKYIEANVPDYEIWDFRTSDWLNYSRTFEPGSYQVFLRAASSVAQSVALERMTQGQEALGEFQVPATSGGYAYVPLTDENGQALAFELDGVETLRLTGSDAEEGVHLNFLLFLAISEAPEQILLSDPIMSAEGFSFSFTAEVGKEYTVEYKDDLSSASWTILETIVATSESEPVTDPAPASSLRVYQVRY